MMEPHPWSYYVKSLLLWAEVCSSCSHSSFLIWLLWLFIHQWLTTLNILIFYIFHFLLSRCKSPVPSVQFSSVTQSCPTLRPRELQHARPPCPSPIPGVHPNPCPSSQWCHPTTNMSANLENSAVATGLKKVNFHSNSRERQCQRMFKLPHSFTHFTC